MPFPFLIGAGVLLAGAASIGGHLSAKEKNEKAQRICQKAKRAYDDQVEAYTNMQENLNTLFKEVANNKSHVIKNTIPKFKNWFEEIKKLDDVYSLIELNHIKDEDIDQLIDTQKHLQQYCEDLKDESASDADSNEALIGLAGFLGPGAVAGYGAVTGFLAGGVGAGLTGALSATLVSPLAIVAAPLFLFSAFSADSKADEHLAEAKKYKSEINAECETISLKIDNMQAIGENANIYGSLLLDLEVEFKKLIKKMGNIIRNKKSIYSGKIPKNAKQVFSKDELEIIRANFSTYNALKTLVNAPLFDEELKLNPNISNIMNEVSNAINKPISLSNSDNDISNNMNESFNALKNGLLNNSNNANKIHTGSIIIECDECD